MTIHYDCASAPADENLKILCFNCRQVLTENGYSAEEAGSMGMGKCAMCHRRAAVWPTRIKKN